MLAVVAGVLVLMINDLPPRWGMSMLAGILLPLVTVMMPEPRRFFEVCLMFSFAIEMDVHFGNDPAHMVDPAGFPVSLTGLMTCALIVWWFIGRFGERPRQSLWGGMGIPIVGLWATSLWSIPGSLEPRFGLFGLINLTYFTLLFLYLANNVTSREHLRSLLGWLMLAIGLTSVVAVGEYVFGRVSWLSVIGMLNEEKVETVLGTDLQRVGGLLGSSNGLATVLVQMLPLMLVFFLSPTSEYRKPLLVSGLGVGVLALIFTYSRGGWMTFALMVVLVPILMAMRQVSGSPSRWFRRAAIVGSLLLLLATPLYGNVYTRLTEDDRGSAQSRLPMAEVAMRIIQDNPFFGVGLGNYENVMRRYDRGPNRVHQDFPWPVHNIYLNITAEIGLIGGLGFVWLCTLGLWQGGQAMRRPDPFLRAAAIGLVVGLIGFLIIGLKELGPLGSVRYRWFWLALGLLVATRRISDQHSATGVEPAH
jgi:O-antigen ligase